jgi:hypothetical protein
MTKGGDPIYVKIREENGRLYVGESEKAYVKYGIWSIFGEIKPIKYVEKYELSSDDKFRMKRWISASITFGRDQISIIGDPSIVFDRDETMPIDIYPTLDLWTKREGFEWTICIDWYDGFFASLAIPDDYFDRIADHVIGGRVARILLSAGGGLYLDEGAEHRYEPGTFLTV